MNNGSQQATKAAPKHTHNNRHLSECSNKQVLRQLIFSIGQYHQGENFNLFCSI